MKKVLVILGLLLVAAMAATACHRAKDGGKTIKEREMEQIPEDYDPVSAILGDGPLDTDAVMEEENEQAAAAAAPLSPDEDLIGGSMGVFLPTVTIAGEPVKATYKVLTADAANSVVAENLSSDQETELHPGTYDMSFTVKKVAGSPALDLRGVEIVAGRRLKRKVKFPVGEITLVTGGRCVRTSIKIKQKGASDWLPGKYFTCKPIKLMAGEYEADRAGTPITGIQVYDGGTRNILIRKQ